MYIIKLDKHQKCSITIKKKIKLFLKKTITNNTFKYLTNSKISSTKLYKNDKNITNELIKLMDKDTKYTYCLNPTNLTIAETNKSTLKNMLSKHALLCNDTACASGELLYIKTN